MAQDCYVQVTLNSRHSEDAIRGLLLSGQEHGFKYYDYALSKTNDDVKSINAKEATDQIIHLFNSKSDDGAYVLVNLNDGSDFMLWFYKDEQTRLKMVVGAFGADCKKKGYWIDLSYYIPIFLSICRDFTVLELSAQFLGD